MTSEEQNNTPPLYGLVLAGGRSVRMGQDKGTMQWHGVPQREYMARLLAGFCEKVYISCREEQTAEMGKEWPLITDAVSGAGPLTGILSALMANNNVAWLVVACDLPLLSAPTLHYLLAARRPGSIATTYRSPHDSLPEPLITIWEPAALPYLHQHIAAGYKCPRKALINNATLVNVIDCPWPQHLLNANTPEDAAEVQRIMAQG